MKKITVVLIAVLFVISNVYAQSNIKLKDICDKRQGGKACEKMFDSLSVNISNIHSKLIKSGPRVVCEAGDLPDMTANGGVNADNILTPRQRQELQALKGLGKYEEYETKRSKMVLAASKKYFLTEDKCLANEKTAKEVKLIKRLIIEVSDYLSPSLNTLALGEVNLKEQIKNETFLVNHYYKGITENYLGFGPEDDPLFLWQYPDYFPEGSIKVNLTELAFQFIEFYYEYLEPNYKKNNPEVLKGAFGIFTKLVPHESLHGWQLKTEPVQDIKRYSKELLLDAIEKRNIDKKLVQGTSRIIEYERDAFLADRINFRIFRDSLPVFGKEFKKLLEEKPEVFKNYPLLTKNNRFYSYYVQGSIELVAEATKERKGEETMAEVFGNKNKYSYLLQSMPLETLYFMIEVNNEVKAGANPKQYKNIVAEKYNAVMELADPNFNGRNDEDLAKTINTLTEAISGLKEIIAAMKKEFDYFYSSLAEE